MQNAMVITAEMFEDWKAHEGNFLWGLVVENVGILTVLDRPTGYSFRTRDIETGFRNTEGKFWLATGNFDIREALPLTLGEAVAMVKVKSNLCVGD